MNATRDSAVLNGLRALTLGLVLASAAGAGHAAVYTGVWDPAFGQPFSTLGWRGSSQFFVPDACVPVGTVDIDNAANCGGLAAVSSASVELYGLDDPDNTLITLVFNPAAMLVSTLRYVDGELTQLVTSSSNLLAANITLSGLTANPNRRFGLDFTLTGPRLGWYTCDANERNCRLQGYNDGVSFPVTFAITRDGAQQHVPEPSSLWLSGLALVGLMGAFKRGARAAKA